jgi:hypothetical protein
MIPINSYCWTRPDSNFTQRSSRNSVVSRELTLYWTTWIEPRIRVYAICNVRHFRVGPSVRDFCICGKLFLSLGESAFERLELETFEKVSR